eukprot:COSAG01_NODE_2576_length_7432_cov_4.664167_1_plen_452_part_00
MDWLQSFRDSRSRAGSTRSGGSRADTAELPPVLDSFRASLAASDEQHPTAGGVAAHADAGGGAYGDNGQRTAAADSHVGVPLMLDNFRASLAADGAAGGSHHASDKLLQGGKSQAQSAGRPRSPQQDRSGTTVAAVQQPPPPVLDSGGMGQLHDGEQTFRSFREIYASGDGEVTGAGEDGADGGLMRRTSGGYDVAANPLATLALPPPSRSAEVMDTQPRAPAAAAANDDDGMAPKEQLWEGLGPMHREYAQLLGWRRDTWDAGDVTPFDQKWGQLSADQRAAAEELGFCQAEWDEGGSEAGQGETSHVSADWLEQSVTASAPVAALARRPRVRYAEEQPGALPALLPGRPHSPRQPPGQPEAEAEAEYNNRVEAVFARVDEQKTGLVGRELLISRLRADRDLREHLCLKGHERCGASAISRPAQARMRPGISPPRLPAPPTFLTRRLRGL